MPVLFKADKEINSHLVLLYEEVIHPSFYENLPDIQQNHYLTCLSCKITIKGKSISPAIKFTEVTHVIWDSPHFPCTSENQDFFRIRRAYCPNCEVKPGRRGLPIIIPGSFMHKLLEKIPNSQKYVIHEILQHAYDNDVLVSNGSNEPFLL